LIRRADLRAGFLLGQYFCWASHGLPGSERLDDEEQKPMSVGLIGLLDDIAAIAKVAAASLDDVASQAAKAGVKAAGVVIDDTAVTPGYVIGFEPKRELPIVGKIAAGSLRNKLLVLLPAALLLSYFLPWTITPLLMLGGAYLCYEGVEKVLEAVMPHSAQQHEAQLGTVALNATSVEDQKVASAIKTDFILSAEIMAITLAALPPGSIWKQALVLAVVAIGITLAVYGVVALIVKADDVGVALARSGSRLSRAVGRGIVRGMPVLLTLLSVVGTSAMIWVGGGIVLHGLEVYGPPAIHHAVEAAAEAVARVFPPPSGILRWAVEAAISGVLGLLVGAASIPAVGYVLAPGWAGSKRLLRR
jgi:predicted DNA repair protein MutK